MGYVFEHLIRKVYEDANATAGEHFIAPKSSTLPASAGDRKRSIRGLAVMVALVWGCLSLLPVP